MSQFVLVHGSFQGGWIWQPTEALLRSEGHDVYVPTLDGCAERKVNLRPGLSITSVANELVEALFYQDMSEIILVGTSSGGLVVEKTAALARDRIQRLVFLDALVPQPGESVKDIVQHPAGAPNYQITEFTRGLTREQLGNGMFSELSGKLKDWALDRVTPHPLGLSDQEPGELDKFWEMAWQATVIYCTESANPPESHQRRTADRLGAKWLVMEAGHYPMLTHPKETSQLLQS